MAHIPMLGRVFGSWTVVSGPYGRHWGVQCACGGVHKVSGPTLRGGTSTMCRRCAHKDHGLSKTSRAYISWTGMHNRCYDPQCDSWEDYGGRGITICDRWFNNFRNFYADMGERPEGMEIDRQDNDGNYEPGNCRWATASQNARNKRTTVWVEYAGRTVSLAEAAELSGIHYETLRSRVNRGTVLFQKLRPVDHPRHKKGTTT